MTKQQKPAGASAVSLKLLRHIKRSYPQLAHEPAAKPIMERLAELRARFAELSGAIESGGGAAVQLELSAELRQISRGCSALEQQLKNWWASPVALNPFVLFRETCQRRLTRAAIDADAEPVPVAENGSDAQPAAIRELLGP